MDCEHKIRYSTERMAELFAQTHNKNPFIKKEEELIRSYHCLIHQGWHVGHTDTRELPPHIKVQRILDELGHG